MAAKAVVRTFGGCRAKSYGPGGQNCSKMIPFEVGSDLAKAFEQEEICVDVSLPMRRRARKNFWDSLALKLGKASRRNVGKHAGGVVIAPTQS